MHAGPYQGDDYDDDEMSVSLVEDTGVPGENTQMCWQTW